MIPLNLLGRSPALTDPSAFGRFYSWRTVQNLAFNSDNFRLINGNGQRSAILFSFYGSGSGTISTNILGAPTEAILEFVSPNVFTMTFADFGALVQSEWFGHTSAPTWSINVTEVVYTPSLCLPDSCRRPARNGA